MGPKVKKKKARKRLTPLEKIRKELGKLEALHAKEEAIIENINEIIEEGEEDSWENMSYGGTDPD